MEQSSDLTIRLRAAALRKKLLTGVPMDSAYRRIVESLDDEVLIAKADAHHKMRVDVAVTKNKNQE